MAKNQRNLSGAAVRDPSILDNLIYNEAAGARKSVPTGPHLLPLGDGAGGYTTDASTARILPSAGRNLAVYNNAGTVGSITLGEDNTVTAQAPGAVQAGTTHVGVACAPNAWSYISTGNSNWVISSAATLLVYLVDDETSIKQEVATFQGQ